MFLVSALAGIFGIILEGTALDSVASALMTALNTNAMLANLATLIPVLAGLILFAFTWRVIRKMVSGAPKGKVKI